MDVQAYRQNLIQQLSQVTSEKILRAIGEQLEKLTNSEKQTDWWNELSAEEKDYLKRGLQQAKNGETVSSEEVHRKVEQLLGKK